MEGDKRMSVGLVSARGEESDGGFGGRYGEATLIRPLRHTGGVGGEGARCGGDVRAGE